MFESLIADFLTKTIGKYIEDLDVNSVSVSLWNGNVQLKNLQVKKDACSAFNLPVIISKGILKTLEVEVPWKSIKTDPFKIKIKGLHIISQPQTVFVFDAEQYDLKKKEHRKEIIDRFEIIQQIAETKAGGDESGVWTTLVNKIIENLELEIEDINFIYKGDENEGIIGFHLNSIVVKNSMSITDTINKVCQLNNLSIILYDELNEMNDKESEQQNEKGLNSFDLMNKTVLATIPSFQFNLSIEKTMRHKVTLGGEIQQIFFSLNKKQYSNVMHIVERMTNYTQTIKYLYCRPTVSALEQPKKWWKFAFIATRDYLREREEEKNPIRFDFCSTQRERFIELFKKVRKIPWVIPATNDEIEEYNLIENQLRNQEICYLRQIAYKIVSEEKKIYESTRGWFGFGYQVPELSEEAINQIYNAIDYKHEEYSLPPETIVFEIKTIIQKIQFKLIDEDKIVCKMKIEKMNIGFEARVIGLKLNLSFDNGEVKENKVGLGKIWTKLSDEKSFKMEFEESPIDKHCDAIISIDCAPSVINCSKGFFDSLVDFLTLPSNLNLNYVKQFAEYQLQQLYSSAASQIDIFADEPPLLDIRINLTAPVIYFYYDGKEKGMDNNIALFQLGNVKITNSQRDENYQNYDIRIDDVLIKFLDSIQDQFDSKKNIVVQKTGATLQLSTLYSSEPIPKIKLGINIDPFIAQLSKRKYDKLIAYIYLLLSFFPSDNETTINTNQTEDIDVVLVKELVKKQSELSYFIADINIPLFHVLLSRMNDITEESTMTSVKIERSIFGVNVTPSAVTINISLGQLIMDNGYNTEIPYLVTSDIQSKTIQKHLKEERGFQIGIEQPFLQCSIKVIENKVSVDVAIDTFTLIYEPQIISEIIIFSMSLTMLPESDSTTNYIYNININLSHFYTIFQSEIAVLAICYFDGLNVQLNMDSKIIDLTLKINEIDLKNTLYEKEDPRYTSIVSVGSQVFLLHYTNGTETSDILELKIGEVICNYVMNDFFKIINVIYNDQVKKAIDLTSVQKKIEEQYEYLKKTVTSSLLDIKKEPRKTTDIKIKAPTLIAYLPSGQVIVRIGAINIEDGNNGWEILFDKMKITTNINRKKDRCINDFTFSVNIPLVEEGKQPTIITEFPCADIALSPNQFKLLLDFVKTFFSSDQSNEESQSIKRIELCKLPPISKNINLSIGISIKQFEISIKEDCDIPNGVSKLSLINFIGNVDLTDNSYAMFHFTTDNLMIIDTRTKVEMEEYRNIFKKSKIDKILTVVGNYSIQYGNIQSNLDIYSSSLILTPQFITKLINTLNIMFDGNDIILVNPNDILLHPSTKVVVNCKTEENIQQSEIEESTNNFTENQSIINSKPNSNISSPHKNTIPINLNNSNKSELINSQYVKENLIHLGDDQDSFKNTFINKGLKRKSQKPSEIIKYLNEACPMEMTFAEVILVLKANYEWSYPQYVCEYICEELVKIGVLVPTIPMGRHIPNIDSSITYVTCNIPNIDTFHIDLTSFQPCRPISSAISPDQIHVFTISLHDTAIIAVQDDSPDTALLHVTIDATICHTVTQCGSTSLAELNIIDVRSCFSRGHHFDLKKGIQLSQGISLSTSIIREGWDNWFGIRGSVTVNNAELITTFSDWKLILYFINLLGKFGGETNYEIDSECSIRIDLNGFKLIVGNPLRKDPLFRMKIPSATVVYRSRNDDSILRVLGQIKVDGYNPQTREYDVMLEKTLMEFSRRSVVDCIQGSVVTRVLTNIDLGNIECILTVDLMKEMKRVFQTDFWTPKEENLDFIPIQFIDEYSAYEKDSLMVSITNCGVLKLNNKLQHFENMTLKREYTELKKCMVFTPEGEGIEVPIICEGEYVHKLRSGYLVISVIIQQDSSKIIKFSSLLAIQNDFEEELFISIQIPNPIKINKLKNNNLRGLFDTPRHRLGSNNVVKSCHSTNIEATPRPRLFSTSDKSSDKFTQQNNDVPQLKNLLNVEDNQDEESQDDIPDFIEVQASIPSKGIFYVPPQFFNGQISLCSSRLSNYKMPLKDLMTEKYVEVNSSKCILTRISTREIVGFVQTTISLAPSLIVTNLLPMPFSLKTPTSVFPVRSLSSISTFINPDSPVFITIAGYNETLIPKSGELKIFGKCKGYNSIRYFWDIGTLRIDAEEWVFNRSFIPLKFSLDKKNYIGGKIGLRNNSQPLPITRFSKPLYIGTGNSWSRALLLEKAEEVIRIIENGITYDLVVGISIIDGIARQITIRPAFMAVNDLGCELYCSVGSNYKDVIIIPPKGSIPIYGSFSISSSINVSIRCKGPWCRVPIDKDTHFQLLLLTKENGSIEEGQATTISIHYQQSVIIHFQEIQETSKYVIENDTDYSIIFKHIHSDEQTQIEPRKSQPVVFPNTSHISTIQIKSEFSINEFVTYSLDNPEVYEAKAGIHGIVYPYTWIFNGVNKLVFTDKWEKMKGDIGGLIRKEKMNTTEFNITINKLGIDLIDEDREELAYISLKDITYNKQGTLFKNKHRLFIGPIQVDSNARDCSVAVPFVSKGINICVDIVSQQNNTYKHIPHCFIQFQNMFISLETPFLNRIIHLIRLFSNPKDNKSLQIEIPKLYIEPIPYSNSQTITFETLQISPVDIILNTMLSSSSLLNIGYNSFTAPLLMIGNSLLTIKSARIHLNDFISNKLSATPERLSLFFIDFYRSQAIQQLLLAVSSMEFIGAPGVLVHSVYDGITDFITIPQKEKHSGNGIATGLAKGTESLLLHSIHGISSTAASISNTFGNLTASLTFDEDYIKERERKKKPFSASEGMAQGLGCVVNGIVDGVKGVITQPIKGAQTKGVSGFVGGVGKGLIGVVLKPTGGVVDFVSKMTEGIAEESGDIIPRSRIPRVGNKRRRIMSYNEEEAKIAWILQRKGLGDFVIYVTIDDIWVVLTETSFVMMKESGVMVSRLFQDLSIKVGPKTVTFSHFGHQLLTVSYRQGKHMRNFIRTSQQFIKQTND
ncbi:vacuolar protein sorting-associated protein, putative [Entamoeba histolytica KU27]|uniref:Vacuolar protein sorting-associated protein, putative n=1 Tax=Entamoeba histolytica KU27 TaxID=885311 RepID=M2QCP9_ENTHI|nr:vacuolar protein sorting-associated protein, putative [Entamoeba histolytica KU27]